MAYTPPFLATNPPAADGVQAVGVSVRAAREDHVHPVGATNTPFGLPRVVSATGPVSNTDGWLRFTTSAGICTLTLPNPPLNGQQILIENLSNNVQFFTVANGSGQTLIQPNSNAAGTSYQIGGGVCVTMAWEATTKIWKLR